MSLVDRKIKRDLSDKIAAFGVRIPVEDLGRFQTVGDAIDYIQRAMVAASVPQ